MGRVGCDGMVERGLVVMEWWREGWLWDVEIPGAIEGDCA